MASIEKRGDFTYRITVSDGYDRDGKKITHKKKVVVDASLTPKQAEKELKRIAAIFEDEVKKGNCFDSSITFEKFTEQWLIEHAEKRLERVTVEGYKMHLKTKILPAIGHIKLGELKPIHLIKFYDNLTEDGVRLDGKEGGYSTRIINYQHQIISSILQTAVFWQIINENVSKRVKPPKGVESRKVDNYFDELQVKNFLEFVLETEPLEYAAMGFVTAYGGLRKGEILGLCWSDVDFESNCISINKALSRASREEFVKQPKNKSSVRIVTLSESVMILLKKLKLKSTSTRVFPFKYLTPLSFP